MSRNAESHFATLPKLDIQRSVLDRSHSLVTSFDVGQCIPIFVDSDILPGDSVDMKVSKVLRLQTLIAPVFSPMYADVMFWFVPHRLVWDHWEEFNGENKTGPWVQTNTYKVPCISAPSGGFNVGTIADYLGWPVGVNWNSQAECAPNVLALRAYALCMSEFMRDENLTYPLNIPTGDSNQTGSNGSSYINDVANGGAPFVAAKLHDWVTSCLPSAQKAARPVSFPLISGSLAEVYSGDIHGRHANDSGMIWKRINGSSFSGNVSMLLGADSDPSHATSLLKNESSQSAQSSSWVTPVNLWADLSQTVGSVTINQMRLAFQLQRYYEKLARNGSRYIETCRAFFGTAPNDARLQRPEYLGGNRVPLNVSEVVNHAQTQSDFLGDLGAMSKTGDVDHCFFKSFQEHGTIIGIVVVRYPHVYSGLDPMYLRRDLTDFYNPVFANIGEQPVYTVSIYPDATNMATKKVFGFQEAWSEYRYKQSRVTSLMRPNVTGSLAVWNLADNYASEPTLSDGWIREDKAIVDRALAVSSSVSNQILGDFYFDCKYTRPMPVYSIPGLIDHN